MLTTVITSTSSGISSTSPCVTRHSLSWYPAVATSLAIFLMFFSVGLNLSIITSPG